MDLADDCVISLRGGGAFFGPRQASRSCAARFLLAPPAQDEARTRALASLYSVRKWASNSACSRTAACCLGISVRSLKSKHAVDEAHLQGAILLPHRVIEGAEARLQDIQDIGLGEEVEHSSGQLKEHMEQRVARAAIDVELGAQVAKNAAGQRPPSCPGCDIQDGLDPAGAKGPHRRPPLRRCFGELQQLVCP